MKFNETKSQERFINVMINIGIEWPCGAEFAVRDVMGVVMFSISKPEYIENHGVWRSESWVYGARKDTGFRKNWQQTIITREQYEARDGWITWHGGECPLDGDVVVQVKLKDDEPKWGGIGNANTWTWESDGGSSEIIAYRPHKPSQQQQGARESVSACIPDQPTIEHLIKAWKDKEEISVNMAAELEDSVESAKAAKRAVQEALHKAGWDNQVDESFAEHLAARSMSQHKESIEQPEITDWRDLRSGDLISVDNVEYHVYLIADETDPSPYKICTDEKLREDHAGRYYDWIDVTKQKWKFIRRP